MSSSSIWANRIPLRQRGQSRLSASGPGSVLHSTRPTITSLPAPLQASAAARESDADELHRALVDAVAGRVHCNPHIAAAIFARQPGCSRSSTCKRRYRTCRHAKAKSWYAPSQARTRNDPQPFGILLGFTAAAPYLAAIDARDTSLSDVEERSLAGSGGPETRNHRSAFVR